MSLHVGTSGFGYEEWRGSFYPSDLKKDGMLPFYAERLPSVELNNTFYRLPNAATVAKWRGQVPATFRFAVKAPQRLSYGQRLRDCAEPLQRLATALTPPGDTLGCVFVQVPKWVPKDLDALREFLSLAPPQWRVAFEFAAPSWFEPDSLEVLRAAAVALVASDKDGEPPPTLHDTARWGYLRLRRASYSDDQLRAFRDRLLAVAPDGGFVFFKHEDSGAGPELARRFLAL